MKRTFSVFLVITSVLAGPVNHEDSSVENNVDDETYLFEDKILEFLEEIRQLMKNGDPEKGIPPMEPLQINNFRFDFILEDTELEGVLKTASIANLSDFEIRKLSVNLNSLKVQVVFQELDISGFHQIVGILFGEYPVDSFGQHRINMKNVTLTGDMKLCSLDGVLQIKNLNLNYDIQEIEITYQNLLEGEDEKKLDEHFIRLILQRVRTEYLPLLLNTAKIVANDFLAGLKDLDEEMGPGIFFRTLFFLGFYGSSLEDK